MEERKWQKIERHSDIGRGVPRTCRAIACLRAKEQTNEAPTYMSARSRRTLDTSWSDWITGDKARSDGCDV